MRAGLTAYAYAVALAALLSPLLALVSPEAGAVRNGQYVALLVGLAVAVGPALRVRVASLGAPGLRLLAPALAIWMLAGEAMNYFALQINGVDFSLFDLTLEETLRGRFMYSPVYRVNHFGVHQTWWMLPLVPLHAIWRSPGLLILVNVGVLVAACVPLWRLAHRVDPLLGPLSLIAHATNPWTARLLRDGFRPESLYPLCIFALADAWMQKRHRGVLGWGLALCLIKEDASLYVLAFAAAAVATRALPRTTGALLALTAVAILVLDLEVIRPWQLGPGGAPGYVQFWEGYGTSLAEVAVSALRHPVRALLDVATSRWWSVLGPALLLPLARPVPAASMAPGLLMLGLASSESMRQFRGYYPVPVACICILGIICFALHHRRRQGAVALSLLAALLFPLFGGNYFRIHTPERAVLDGLDQVRAAIRDVKDPICVQTAILPHLPYGRNIEPLDPSCRGEQGALLLLSAEAPSWPDSRETLRAAIARARAAGTARTFPGGFHLIPSPAEWP